VIFPLPDIFPEFVFLTTAVHLVFSVWTTNRTLLPIHAAVSISSAVCWLRQRAEQSSAKSQTVSLVPLTDFIPHPSASVTRTLHSPNHCLNHQLPVCTPLETLRPRGHNYFLPEYCTELHKRSFIIISLYRFDWLFAVHFFYYLHCIIALNCLYCVRLSHSINDYLLTAASK